MASAISMLAAVVPLPCGKRHQLLAIGDSGEIILQSPAPLQNNQPPLLKGLPRQERDVVGISAVTGVEKIHSRRRCPSAASGKNRNVGFPPHQDFLLDQFHRFQQSRCEDFTSADI